MPVIRLLFLTAMCLVMPGLLFAAEKTSDSLAGWPRTDVAKHAIPVKDISRLQDERNNPPSIDKPRHISLASPTDLGGLEPVLSIEIDGEWRAYPLQILTRHQVINDIIGGVPVMIAFCPLKKSAAVFERRIGGKVLTFGNTGLAYDNNILLYDVETESFWRHIDGASVVGDLTGQNLRIIPANLESYAQFQARIPEEELEEASVMAPTALSKRPALQTDADSLIIPLGDTRTGKSNSGDRVVVVGEDDWALSVLQRLGTEERDRADSETAKKDKPFRVYYRNGTLQVPYETEESEEAEDETLPPRKKPD